MKIDIHRHAGNPGKARRVIRNLFHDQQDQISEGNFYSAGLHPWHVKADTFIQDLEAVRSLAAKDEVIAIGEAGLDKSIKTNIDLQKYAFSQQILIATEHKKPLIIHCVKAYDEVYRMRKESSHNYAWIIHWFNASKEMGRQLIGEGFYLSFGHMLFNEKSKAYKAFPNIPPENIFLETDDSNFTIQEIYVRAALLRGISESMLEKTIEKNFKTCFGKKP